MVPEAESIIRGGQSWHPQWHRETLTSSMFRKQHSVVTDWVTSFTGKGTAKAQGQRAAQWMPGRRGGLASGCLWVITSLELDRCAGCATHASTKHAVLCTFHGSNSAFYKACKSATPKPHLPNRSSEPWAMGSAREGRVRPQERHPLPSHSDNHSLLQ